MEQNLQLYFQSPEDYENQFYPPVEVNQFDLIETSLGIQLPDDYKAFLRTTNGFDGMIGESYCVLNKIEDLPSLTVNYCKEFFPWAIHIGSNGGGEMYVLDKRGNSLTYGMLPYIGEDDDYIPLGQSFLDFIKRLYQSDIN